MKTVKFIFTLLIIIVFTSCEDVIQVKLDEGTPIITIDAFLNDLRSTQKVRLTYTDSYFSQKPNQAITGAIVTLRDITSGVDYSFTDANDGDYLFNLSSTDTIAKIGHLYQLTVMHQGNTFTATSLMKRTARIDSIVSKIEKPGAFGGQDGYRCAFIGFDIPGDTTDYYWIKSYKNGILFNKGSNINICVDAAYGAGADGFPFIPPIAESITPFGEIFNKYDVCRVEIHSISLETYNFLTQIQKQTTNSGLFATSPENIKTNIRNTSGNNVKVVGWFCMSAVNYKEAVAQ